jgi:hypothetical protein
VANQLAKAVMSRHQSDKTAMIKGLIEGGATPEQLVEFGFRAGIYTAGYERGMAAALGGSQAPIGK